MIPRLAVWRAEQPPDIPGSDSQQPIHVVDLPVYTLPSGLALLPGQSSVQTVMSSRPEGWPSCMPRSFDVSREGPFDAYSSPMDTVDSPWVTTYRITSYTGPAVADTNPAFGMQLHHPRFLEFIGAPESARLLYHSPAFWIQCLGEDALAAAVNLQRDAGIMLSNLQILSQFVTSLHRMSSEILNLGMGRVVFPSEEGRGFVYSTDGAPGGQVPCCDGFMASTDWSGRSRAGAGFVLQRLHELSV